MIITSLFLICAELIASLVLRLFKTTNLALHIGFVGMVVNALNLIYQTGGVIISPQAFWIPLLIISFFLTASLTMAICWSGIVIAITACMLNQSLHNTESVDKTSQISESVVTQGTQLSQQVIILKTLADDLNSVMELS